MLLYKYTFINIYFFFVIICTYIKKLFYFLFYLEIIEY